MHKCRAVRRKTKCRNGKRLRRSHSENALFRTKMTEEACVRFFHSRSRSLCFRPCSRRFFPLPLLFLCAATPSASFMTTLPCPLGAFPFIFYLCFLPLPLHSAVFSMRFYGSTAHSPFPFHGSLFALAVVVCVHNDTVLKTHMAERERGIAKKVAEQNDTPSPSFVKLLTNCK